MRMRIRPVMPVVLTMAGLFCGSLARAQLTARPFTATMVESRFDGAGVKDGEETSLIATRADGSSVKASRRKFPDGKIYEPRIIVDVPNRKRIVIDPATESVTTYPLAQEDVLRIVSKMTSCNHPATEHQQIANFDTVREQTEPQNGRSAVDRWLAPALDCFPLKQTAYQKAFDPTSAHNETIATSVSLGEPDPALFAVPSTYSERSPIEVAKEFAKRFPNAVPVLPPGSAEGYQNAQKKH